MHIEWRLPPTLVRPLFGFGALVMVVGAGWWWLSAPVQTTPVPAEVIRPLSAAETSAAETVMVHVVGAVLRPGVVRLPQGARVIDAVVAAGGLLPNHRPVVNMARRVEDGEQIQVGAPARTIASSGVDPAAPGRIDLNSASVAQLDGLPGIGPVLAARIVEYRADHGPFAHVRDLLDVPGIGDAKFSEIADAVSAA